MNKIVKYCFLTSLVMVHLFSESVRFNWNLKKGMTINLYYNGKNIQYVNNAELPPQSEYNIINLTVIKEEQSGFLLKGQFKTFTDGVKQNEKKLLRRYNANFIIYPDGRYLVPNGNVQPTIRSLPSFPRRSVSPGDSWAKPAQFNYHDITPPYFFTTQVEYKYLSNIGNSAIILINYSFDKIANRTYQGEGGEWVSRLYGQNFSILSWNIEKNIPIKKVEKFNEYFIIKDKGTINISKEFTVNYNITFPISDKMLTETKKKVDKIKGLSSYIDTDGLHILLGEVLFEYDSSTLTTTAISNIKKLTPILNRYKDYEFLIEGHTDNIGSDRYNLRLSEHRAAEVSGFLKQMLPESINQIYYEGLGATDPIGDNTTEEGRKKNRRVEIHIRQSGK